MANENELKLLPEIRRSIDYHPAGQNKLFIFSFIFLAFIGVIYGGLFFYKKSALDNLSVIDQQLVENEKARSPADEKKILKAEEDLKAVQPIINNHLFSSEAFLKLKKLINPQVQLDSLSINSQTGEYSFKAFAANFSIVAKQIAAFYSDDAITNVSLGKISSSATGRVEFSATVKFNIDKTLRKNIISK